MDAKITKQRLGNMLAYDWLKILAAIVGAIVLLSLLFTTVRTRPRDDQKFAVHGYGGLYTGEAYNRLSSEIESLFSYDILDTTVENFSAKMEGEQVFSARRSVGEGTVVIAADYTASETEGALTPFASLASAGLRYAGTSEERVAIAFYLDDLFDSAEKYFTRFFGENWETEKEPDADAVRTYFNEVQKKDKRFRSAANRERGIELETERIKKLKEDYLFVQENGFATGKFTPTDFVTRYTVNSGGEETEVEYRHTVGINIGSLLGISKLFDYSNAEGGYEVSALTLMVYNNGARSDRNKYEVFTFLRFLLERYDR